MPRSCMVAVAIFIFAPVVVLVVLLSSSSLDEYLVCGRCRAMGRKKQQRYYGQKLVGSYGGVAALRQVVPDQDVERRLSEQDTYTLHKPVRRRFNRRCVVVGGPNEQCQAYLVDVSRLKKTNYATAFLLR